MAQFKFKNNEVVFDIEGKEYTVPIEKAQKAMRRLGDMQEKAAKATEEDFAYICEEIVGIIDEALGEGSCAEIFGDRIINIYDLCDLIAYMAGEVTAFAEDKKKEYGVL